MTRNERGQIPGSFFPGLSQFRESAESLLSQRCFVTERISKKGYTAAAKAAHPPTSLGVGSPPGAARWCVTTVLRDSDLGEDRGLSPRCWEAGAALQPERKSWHGDDEAGGAGRWSDGMERQCDVVVIATDACRWKEGCGFVGWSRGERWLWARVFGVPV